MSIPEELFVVLPIELLFIEGECARDIVLDYLAVMIEKEWHEILDLDLQVDELIAV